MNLIAEIYQFLFISSIIFIAYIIFDMAIKMYGRFVQKNFEIQYTLNNNKRIVLWISFSLILSYLIT